MRGVNLWVGIGTLGRDPETRYLPSGDPVTSFSIAINGSYTGKDGKKVETTEWVNLVAFKRLAEIAAEYLRKGSKVYVEGQLRTQTWEKDGQKHYKTEVVCREMQMLDGKQEREPVDQGYAQAKGRSQPRAQLTDDDDLGSIPF